MAAPVERVVTPIQIQAVDEIIANQAMGISFQPIVDLRRPALYAYEALARVLTSDFTGPAELFSAAADAKQVGRLGRMHRESATEICAGRPLFLNVHPNEFEEGWLVRPDDPIFKHRASVTLEITESVPLKYFEQCHSVLAEIRRKGIRLAIDDFGAGFSNLRYILDLEPDVVKLDRELVVGLRRDTRHYRLIESIVELCHRMNASVIAEGVETVDELRAIVDLKVDFAQGYLLARPSNPPPDFVWPYRRY